MERNEYRTIRSFAALRMARAANRKALKSIRCAVPGHLSSLAGALSPKALWERIHDELRPLLALYELFRGRGT